MNKLIMVVRGEERKVIDIFQSPSEALDKIEELLKEAEFKSYYSRINDEPKNNSVLIDFGSHSTFFRITNCSICDFMDSM